MYSFVKNNIEGIKKKLVSKMDKKNSKISYTIEALQFNETNE